MACSGCRDCSFSTSLNIQLNWFNISASPTAQVVSCSDPVCTSTAFEPVRCIIDHCYYTISYEDGSRTYGYYVADILNFDAITAQSTVHFAEDIVFGCSTNESGRLVTTFNALDGILGFGQGKLSVISQLSYKQFTPGIFSHCLRGDGNGTLVLGEVVEPGIIYTPLLPSGPHYTVDLRGISVNGQTVFARVSSYEAIVDSGSTIAYLVEELYDALIHGVTAAFTQSVTPVLMGEVQCYQVPNSTIFLAVTLEFSGGASMPLNLEAYFLDYGLDGGVHLWCMGFQKGHLNVLGDIVLKNKIIVYDLERQRIGWTNYNCSSALNVSTTYMGVSIGYRNQNNFNLFLVILVFGHLVGYA